MLFRILYIFILLLSFVNADAMKMAYLEVIQKSTNKYTIFLKVEAQDNIKPPVYIEPIESCTEKEMHFTEFFNGSYFERYILDCTQAIKGKMIEVKGLDNTNIDLLVRLEFLDKSSQNILLNSAVNTYIIKEKTSSVQVVKTYTWLGITHILMGFDHLLFVFLLLLMVINMRRLLWTISSFTLAHSITMAVATLGLIQMPQKPVEAIIALSILFLALELIYEKRGKAGFASRYPWLIAFIFGLLHGFGFAGALAEIGLPQQSISLALIFFNLGVELGQLMFVATSVIVALMLRHFNYPTFKTKVEVMIIYAIGGVATFWTIDRILAF